MKITVTEEVEKEITLPYYANNTSSSGRSVHVKVISHMHVIRIESEKNGIYNRYEVFHTDNIVDWYFRIENKSTEREFEEAVQRLSELCQRKN
jgi:hypothetical protein